MDNYSLNYVKAFKIKRIEYSKNNFIFWGENNEKYVINKDELNAEVYEGGYIVMDYFENYSFYLEEEFEHLFNRKDNFPKGQIVKVYKRFSISSFKKKYFWKVLDKNHKLICKSNYGFSTSNDCIYNAKLTANSLNKSLENCVDYELTLPTSKNF